MALESFSGEVKIDRDGKMKGTGNRNFVRIWTKNSGGTGRSILHTFNREIEKGTDDSGPAHV